MIGGKQGRLLVVEDDADQRRMLRMALTAAGHSVTTSPDGESALACARSHPMDLVILDIMLAGETDGLGVLARLKANPATAAVPVMIVSAYLDEQRIHELLLSGAELYMSKPYELTVLMQMVERLLRGDAEGRRWMRWGKSA